MWSAGDAHAHLVTATTPVHRAPSPLRPPANFRGRQHGRSQHSLHRRAGRALAHSRSRTAERQRDRARPARAAGQHSGGRDSLPRWWTKPEAIRADPGSRCIFEPRCAPSPHFAAFLNSITPPHPIVSFGVAGWLTDALSTLTCPSDTLSTLCPRVCFAGPPFVCTGSATWV